MLPEKQSLPGELPMKRNFAAVAAGTAASILAFWLVRVALEPSIPPLRPVLAISVVLTLLSACSLALLGFALARPRARHFRQSPLRTTLVAIAHTLVTFLATWLLFRDSEEALSSLWSSWPLALETLPWLLAYGLGTATMLFLMNPPPKKPVSATGKPQTA